MADPVWGMRVATVCYHIAPDCPYLIEKDYQTMSPPTKYENEKEAVKAGHLRPCVKCCGAAAVTDDEGMIRLTVEQIDTLRVVQRIYSETKAPLTLAQIARARERKISTCFRIVKILVKKKLLVKRCSRGGNRKNIIGSILPSHRTSKLLAKIPE